MKALFDNVYCTVSNMYGIPKIIVIGQSCSSYSQRGSGVF